MPPACANQGVSSEAPIGSRKRRFQCGFLPWSGVRPVSVEAFHGFSGRFFRALLSWTKQVSFDKWAVGKCRNDGARVKKFSTSFAKKNFCPFLEGVIRFVSPCKCGCFCHCFCLTSDPIGVLVRFPKACTNPVVCWRPFLLAPFYLFFLIGSFSPPCEFRDMWIDSGSPSKRRKARKCVTVK